MHCIKQRTQFGCRPVPEPGSMLLRPSPHSMVPSDPTDGSICHPGTVSSAGLSCRLWLVTPGFPTEARLSEHRCHPRASQAGRGQAWLCTGPPGSPAPRFSPPGSDFEGVRPTPRPPLKVPRASALFAQSLSTLTWTRRFPAALNPRPHAGKLLLTTRSP